MHGQTSNPNLLYILYTGLMRIWIVFSFQISQTFILACQHDSVVSSLQLYIYIRAFIQHEHICCVMRISCLGKGQLSITGDSGLLHMWWWLLLIVLEGQTCVSPFIFLFSVKNSHKSKIYPDQIWYDTVFHHSDLKNFKAWCMHLIYFKLRSYVTCCDCSWVILKYTRIECGLLLKWTDLHGLDCALRLFLRWPLCPKMLSLW